MFYKKFLQAWLSETINELLWDTATAALDASTVSDIGAAGSGYDNRVASAKSY